MRRLIILLLSLLALTSLGTASVVAQQVHIVQRGDTLASIAGRYGVSLTDLLQTNGLTMQSIIHRGNRIVIPGAGGSQAAQPAQPAAPAGIASYTVQRGDYLAIIAAKYNTTYIILAQMNGLADPYVLHVGQVLTVPATAGAPAAGGGGGGVQAAYTTYTVQPGESLAIIAAKYNTTYFDLARLNGIEDPDNIKIGQTLQVPAPPQPAPAPAPSAAPAAPPPASTASGGFELGGQALGFTQPQAMHHAKMSWVKRQVRWNGNNDPGEFQSWIDHARGLGFKILLSVIGDHGVHGQLASNPGQVYSNFANFLAGLAQRGADGIEVWNETNIGHEWPHGHINGANYTQMLAAAYNAIKAVSPGTLVVSAGPSPTGYWGAAGCGHDGCNDDHYIRQMAAAGAANYMDCVGVHYNAGHTPPTSTNGPSGGHYSWYLPSMVALYRSVFPGKPLCFTELGYVSPEGYPPIPNNFAWGAGTTVAQQAEWLAGAVNFLRGQNTRLMIVWNVDSTTYTAADFGGDPQGGYAIVRPGGGCPACETLRQAMGG